MRAYAVTVAVALFITAASAAISPVLRQQVPELGGPEIPDPNRTCTKSGEKCAGAANFPKVEFAGCCDNRLTCGFPKVIPTGLWGRFCILKSDAQDEAETTSAASTTAAAGATTAEGADAAGSAAGSAADDDEDAASEESADASDDDDVAGAGAGTSATDEEDATGTSEADASAEATDDDDDGSVCFPADATVELKDGSVISMSKLSVGDFVKVGVDSFSQVFMFTHKMADVAHKFVTLETSSGAVLALTKGHYLYVDGALVAASEVRVGSSVVLGDGVNDTVVAVGSKVSAGLYNPQTLDGNVVVNNVLASTYTTAVEPTFAHALLAPFRFLNSFGLTLTSLESGGGVLADIAPRGQAAF